MFTLRKPTNRQLLGQSFVITISEGGVITKNGNITDEKYICFTVTVTRI
jgi:hypothetical protein